VPYAFENDLSFSGMSWQGLSASGTVYLPPAWAHFHSNLHSILFCSVDCFPKTFTGINLACIFD
jgi:hypothetical protein